METQDWTSLLPDGYPDSAKVWIFQSNRKFIEKEAKDIEEQLYQFYAQWKSHGEEVKGWAGLLFQQFVVVMADIESTGVSGCSTDGMVRVIKSLERQYSVNFFDRMMLTFLVNNKAEMLPFSQVQYALDKGYINKDTLVFNNIATDKEGLLKTWLVPLSESWLGSRVSFDRSAAV